MNAKKQTNPETNIENLTEEVVVVTEEKVVESQVLFKVRNILNRDLMVQWGDSQTHLLSAGIIWEVSEDVKEIDKLKKSLEHLSNVSYVDFV